MMKKNYIMMLYAVTLSLSIAEPAYAGQWLSDANGWWWQNDDGSYPLDSWQWLDGNEDGVAECYYFDTQGYCLLNTTTPDGYMVNNSGAWTVNGQTQTQQIQKAQQVMTTSGKTVDPDIFVKSAGIYIFSSGSGGWGTVLDLESDGSFTGYYDNVEKERGAGYYAITYMCEFHGRFKDPIAVDCYSYKVELDGDIVIDSPSGQQYIEDEVLMVYDNVPLGMDEGRVFYIYLPGAPIDQLPKVFVDWVSPGTKSGALPFYGLYNPEGISGFRKLD